jgi:mRNA interferase RelE/StbE
MSYSIEFRPSAKKALRELPRSDGSRILKAIETLSENPYGPGRKKLKGTDFWRIRVGDYRVVYTVVQSMLLVVVIKIGHRREVYRELV